MGVPSLPATDILILAAPFLAILGMAMVGLDERFSNPRRQAGARRYFCEVDDQGGSFLSDPDGNVWVPVPRRQIEGTLVRKDGAAIEMGPHSKELSGPRSKAAVLP